MFQNISDTNLEEENNIQKNKIILQEIFNFKNIILYIVSFLLSIVGLGNFGSPFAISIFISTCSNNIPSGIVFIVSGIGVFLKFGIKGFLIYLFTSILFIISSIVFKPEIKDDFRNEKLKFGSHLLLCSLLVQIIPLFFTGLYFYDILVVFASSLLSYVFYKIFSNSIVVIRDFKNKAAFSIEELMGAVIMLTLILSNLGNLSIAGFSLKHIMCIAMVLILGWKNGLLVGATAGTTIGMILGIFGNEEPLLIAAYAISGLLAGVLSKLGKIGVAIGFIVGNIIFAYSENGNTIEIIRLKEIIVATIVLFAIPKKLEINIRDIIGKTKLLPNNQSRALKQTENVIYKLNNVSETISEIADTYNEVASTTVEDNSKVYEENRNIFIDEVFNNIEKICDSLLYEDITNLENGILEEAFEILVKQDIVDEQDIIDIFEKRNIFIVNGNNNSEKRKIIDEILKVVHVINNAYKTSRIGFIWTQKAKQDKKNISNQLEGVSKVINSVAEELVEDKFENIKEKNQIESLLIQKQISYKDISIKKQKNEKVIIQMFLKNEEDVQSDLIRINKIEEILSKMFNKKIVLQKQEKKAEDTVLHIYTVKDKYKIQVGVAQTTKNKSTISGDSFIQEKLEDGKYLLAISDGMGSGVVARRNSQIAINMLKRLLSSGFEKETSIKLINSTLLLNSNQEMYSTLDITIFDLCTGNMEIIKNGAMPTYIKNKENVQKINTESLPTGIIDNVELIVHDIDLKKGDIIIMCTDGIEDSKRDEPNWINTLLGKLNISDAQKIAELILTEAIDNNYGLPKDDMTVIVGKII